MSENGDITAEIDALHDLVIRHYEEHLKHCDRIAALELEISALTNEMRLLALNWE